ncbi:hypothetical protein D3C87_2167590 [compost metagenome]
MQDHGIIKARRRKDLGKEINFITWLGIKILITFVPEFPTRLFVGQNVFAICFFNVVVDPHILH